MKKKNNVQKIIPPSDDASRILESWNPEFINWDDPTVCALCGKVDCICTIQICNCGREATKCKGPVCINKQEKESK